MVLLGCLHSSDLPGIPISTAWLAIHAMTMEAVPEFASVPEVVSELQVV